MSFLAMPAAPASVASAVADHILTIPSKTAGIFGGAARTGLQAAHVTKGDVRDELHRLENEAGVVALFGLGILVAGAIVWWKVK